MHHLPDAFLLHSGLLLMVTFVPYRGKGRQAGSLFCNVRTPLELPGKCLPAGDLVLKIVLNWVRLSCSKALICRLKMGPWTSNDCPTCRHTDRTIAVLLALHFLFYAQQ